MKIGIYIGRFRPLHNAHYKTIQQMLQENDKVIIIVGSCGKPRDIKNPFVFTEIETMINICFNDKENEKINIFPSLDYNDDTKWLKDIQNIVFNHTTDEDEIYLYGNKKDNSSFYLNLFPQWKDKLVENITNLNATDIRKAFFEWNEGNDILIQTKVPKKVYHFLTAFKETYIYRELVKEYEFINEYKKSWEKAPYAPIFVTTDAIVECCGHILLIQRKAYPGRGLWALPGGFINPDEKIEECMIRELKEETKIDVAKKMLLGSIKNNKVFDNPSRSLRGRTITHAYHLELTQTFLPKVKGSDDAEVAKWFPLAKLAKMGNIIFEDHLDIIADFTGITKEFEY